MRTSVLGATVLAICLVGSAGAAASEAGKIKRGEYLATIMDCTGCHTPGMLLGKPDTGRYLGGSDVGFRIPELGTFYPPNLTPDRETGLGNWSESDIVAAVRDGVRPDGRILVPVMPYHAYGRLTDLDARALAGYLKTLKPVRNAVPASTGAGEQPTAPYMTVVFPQ